MHEINEIRNKILQGDVLEQLAHIPDESIHCVITSPPYWGLRDYNNENQIGLEKNPNDYINKLITISREVKRVLRNDGTYWLNLGDRFSPQSSHKGGTQYDRVKKEANWGERSRATDSIPSYGKAQCLMGIPWAVAFALVDDGWILRRDIIWAKSISFCPTYVGSCMPEPVKNRAVSSHEYVFMLTKSPSKYFYDGYAVREKYQKSSLSRYNYEFGHGESSKVVKSPSAGDGNGFKTLPNPFGRNLRSVWTINPYPTKDCHFATFSPFLIRPMVLASTSEHGCCAICGAPYERIVEKGKPDEEWKKQCGADSSGEYKGTSEKWLKQDALGKSTYTGFNERWKTMQQNASNVKRNVLNGMLETKTVGWKKTCTCDTDEISKPIIMDIFSGSGTIGIVAGLTGRDFIGIEINPEYVKLAYERIPREIEKIKLKEEREKKKREREDAEKELSEKILLLMKNDKTAKNFILNKLVDLEVDKIVESSPQQKLF